MFDISQQQAGQRWDIITPQLREALFSDVNADFVWNLCQNEHLTEEKSYQVAEISGYVLLGFLHPEDLAGELVSSVDLPAPLAKTISDQISSRVFAPLRADIDKVYSPLSKLGGSSIGSAPKILQNIDTSSKNDTAPSNIIPSTPKPTTLSDIGWSKQPAAGLNVGVIAAIPVPTPAPKPTAEPAPMMLHEDTIFKPAEKNVSFTLSKPGGTAEMSMDRGAAQAQTRPAVLEFGGGATSVAGTSVPKPPTSALSSARPMTISTGTRNVSQIIPPTPVPIPRPSQAPATPSLQIPQPLKPPMPPIVKDFL
jgi:hypothetical protein